MIQLGTIAMTSYSIPTHDLSRMIALIKQGQFRTTHVAHVGASLWDSTSTV